MIINYPEGYESISTPSVKLTFAMGTCAHKRISFKYINVQ